jgi:hypothetical protein
MIPFLFRTPLDQQVGPKSCVFPLVGAITDPGGR